MSQENDKQFDEALARRLRSAFEDISASDELVSRIGAQCEAQSRPNIRLRQMLGAAAVLFFVALPLSFHLVQTRRVVAGKSQLAEIHLANNAGSSRYFTDSDPAGMAEFFKNKLGFSPAMLCTGNGVELRGCCVAHYRGNIVGSYGVETPDGFVSVIVVDETPESIGMTPVPGMEDYWRTSYSNCNMVAVRLKGHTYSAVGLVGEDVLLDMLGRLLPVKQ